MRLLGGLLVTNTCRRSFVSQSYHPACPHVGGNGDIYFCRTGSSSPIHHLDEGSFIDREVQAFVELLLLPDCGRHPALIIVPGIDNRIVRQREQFRPNRIE